jgi:porphobilinogen synthase
MTGYPEVRLRRLRRTPALRRLFDQPFPGLEKFVWPVFVTAGTRRREPIDAMPGQQRMSADTLVKALDPLVARGLGGLLIFGLVEDAEKDARGTAAADQRGPVPRAVREVKRRFPELVVCTDVCLCAYTEHGHCGPLAKNGDVDNDAAIALLAQTARVHAGAGADVVAPSAMMDGQVQAIRVGLDRAGFRDTLIMSYSTKFASAMYGPFREAEQSAPQKGDRRGYQGSYENPRLALRESAFDEQEGADILMVKPALFYLDVLARLRERTDLPLAAYNVSGEYAMLIAAAERGWGDLRGMARESLAAIVRGGADIVISYWANRYDELFGDKR